MTSANRMSAEERKYAIIQAAKPLFAANGFNGTSMRDIARAADVSGALLYKHFPGKEEMYKEILSYADGVSTLAVKEFGEMEPGAETLILLVFSIFHAILAEMPGHLGDRQKTHERLLFQSLLEDGAYARMVFDKIFAEGYPIAAKNFETALKDGDIRESSLHRINGFWFIHHLAMALNLCCLPSTPALPRELADNPDKENLIEEAVLFCLRGIGMTDAAIEKYYKPKKMKIYIKGLFAT